MTLEHGQVVRQHLPIEFLSDILLPPVLLILLLSGVVDITVELDKLMPLFQILAHVIDVLLADLQEVLSTGEIVKHDDPTHLVEKLLLEVLTLIEQFLHLLRPLRQHQVLRLLVIVAHLVQLLDQCWVLHFPLLVVLLLEQFVLLLLQELLRSLELELGALHQQEGLLEACAPLLSLVLELRVQCVIDHETLMDRELARHAHEIADSLVQITELRYLCLLQDQLLQIIELRAQAKISIRKFLGHLLDLLASF